MTSGLALGRTPFSISMILSGSVHLGLMLFLIQNTKPPSIDLTEIQLMEVESQIPVTKKIAVTSTQKKSTLISPTEKPTSEVATESAVKSESDGESSSAVELSAQELYKGQIARLLNSKKSYPQIAKQLKQQGRVLVQFLVGKDGKILKAQVVSSSPFESLNRSAENLVRGLSGLAPFPNEIKKTTWLFTVPVDYQM